MYKIPIFKAERDIPGLAEKIAASGKICYASAVNPSAGGLVVNRAKAMNLAEIFRTAANINDDDLYPTDSILATTNWNKNDDVFDPMETWAARHTPSHKPTNMEHDEHEIVGHITTSWAINEDNELIEDDTAADELPDLFHLCNGAVIYKNWEDEVLIKRTEELIEQIQAGEMFVSMEALFRNFDYAVISPDGKKSIVARDKVSAFLTKHLRAYGGTGKYEDYRVGRLLRNITFCGKGYVKKPANPDSIIFSETTDFSKASLENPFDKSSGVFMLCRPELTSGHQQNSNSENVVMSVDEKAYSELKDANTKLVAQLEELKDKLVKADSEKLAAEIVELKAQVEAAKKKEEDMSKSEKDMKAKCDELQAKVDDLTKANEEAGKTIAELEQAKVTETRTNVLVEGGYTREEAAAEVELFANLNDEQFESIAKKLVAAKDKPADKKDEKKEETKADDVDDKGEVKADEKVLEEAEKVEEADLSADAGEQENEDGVNELAKIVAKALNRKVKGE